MVSLWYESWFTCIQSPHFYSWLQFLNLSKWTLVVDILTQDLLALFPLPFQFCEKHQIAKDDFSLVWVIIYTFNLYHEEWSVGNNMVSKIWVGMSTTYIYLLPIQNLKSLAKMQTLNAGTLELIPKKTCQKL